MAAIWTPLMALYSYDNTILNGLHVPAVADLPDGDYIDPIPELSDTTLRQNLLLELAELAPVYSDPDTLKKMIEIWSAMEKNTWMQLWATTLYKYNPIWNKDASYTEDRTHSGSNSGNTSTTYGKTETVDRDTSTITNYGHTVEHKVTGYDTNSYSPNTQDEEGGTDHVTGDDDSTTTLSGTDSGQSAGTFSETEKLVRKEQGNIGVQTTMAMIKEQREIVEFNIYHFIIESFKKRFMIQIY